MIEMKFSDNEQIISEFTGENLSEKLKVIASSDDKITGVSALSLCGAKIYFDYIKCNDKTLEYGLSKAILNFAELRGIKNIYGKNSAMSELYNKLGFKLTDSEYCLSLEGYFDVHCK